MHSIKRITYDTGEYQLILCYGDDEVARSTMYARDGDIVAERELPLPKHYLGKWHADGAHTYRSGHAAYKGEFKRLDKMAKAREKQIAKGERNRAELDADFRR